MRYSVREEKKCAIGVNKKAALVVLGIYTIGFGFGMFKATEDLKNSTSENEINQKSSSYVETVSREKRFLVSFEETPLLVSSSIQKDNNSHYVKPVKRLPISYDNPFKEKLDPNRELNRDEKLAMVLEYHNIDSEFQYYQIVSVLANEGGQENYNECYDVLCAAYNRTLSEAWCHDCEKYNKNEDGTSKDPTLITSQLLWPSQFSGFLPNKAGKDREEYEGTKADEAALDFLYQAMLDGNGVRSHDYTSFNAPWYKDCPASAIQLNPECDGNCYFYKLKESDLNDKAIEIGVELGISR